MPPLVVLGRIHVFVEPPAEHPGRDPGHTSKHRNVKDPVRKALDSAQIRQPLGRQKRGEFFEPHALPPALELRRETPGPERACVRDRNDMNRANVLARGYHESIRSAVPR